MPHASVNGLELCYETAGDRSDPPLLLIAGLGVQLIGWADHVVDPLIEAGHYIIRFDNRDVGLSTMFDDAPSDPQAVMNALLADAEPDVGYTLANMADDAAGLLDTLGIESAHVMGVSMGAMIAQSLAIGHPARVRTLTSVMSTTGSLDVGQPAPEALEALLAPSPGSDRDSRIDHGVKVAEIWASPGHFDAIALRKMFEASWDRVGGTQDAGVGRHICAIVASPPRDAQLANLSVPSLIVHGTADRLISSTGGERTAAQIPGAELLMIDGMGHDLVPAFAPRVVNAVTHLVRSTEAA